MKTRTALVIATVGAALLWLASVAAAQHATELYIPIGRSPGLSGKYTMMGRIDSVSPGHEMMIAGADTRAAAQLTDDTRFYLDRTALKRSNLYGAYGDCKVGAYCEIKYVDNRPGDRANPGRVEWIKIRVEKRSPR